MLLTRLPISIGGFGVDEGVFTYFLTLVGVSVTLGFSIAIINHMIFILVILPGGIIHLLDRPQAKKIDRPA